MKVGDLVKIEKWCKNKHRMAIIVHEYNWSPNIVLIQFLDELQKPPSQAIKTNLVLLEAE